MAFRQTSPFISSTFEDVADFAVALVQYPFASQGHDDHRQQSLNDHNNGMTSATGYAPTTVGNAPFSSWVFQVSPSSSPLSRSSSLSSSEYVSTPLPYIEQSPMYDMMNHQQPLPAGYIVNSPEITWQPHLIEGSMSSELSVSQSVPMWNTNDSGQPSLPPMDYYIQRSASLAATSATQLQTTLHSSSARLAATDAESGIASSDSGSDEDDDDENTSSYSNRQRGTSEYDNVLTAGFLKLGKWSMTNDPFSQPPPRNFICPQFSLPDAQGLICGGAFVRPEHLRRHIKSVHSPLRPFHCKVPRCQKPFSRGDNMKDHYWTHIERGGRAGKNKKMSMPELFAILGPKEKSLKRKLKLKFARSQDRAQRPIVRSKL
jgi:hypothetical protein